MDNNEERDRNESAYRHLKETIKQTYPAGWFVGIADNQIIGAAADFDELGQILRAKGRDPRQVLVVEAGIDYPEYVTILI